MDETEIMTCGACGHSWDAFSDDIGTFFCPNCRPPQGGLDEAMRKLWDLLPEIRSTLTYYSAHDDRVGDINKVNGRLKYGRRADELLSKLPGGIDPLRGAT